MSALRVDAPEAAHVGSQASVSTEDRAASPLRPVSTEDRSASPLRPYLQRRHTPDPYLERSDTFSVAHDVPAGRPRAAVETSPVSGSPVSSSLRSGRPSTSRSPVSSNYAPGPSPTDYAAGGPDVVAADADQSDLSSSFDDDSFLQDENGVTELLAETRERIERLAGKTGGSGERLGELEEVLRRMMRAKGS